MSSPRSRFGRITGRGRRNPGASLYGPSEPPYPRSMFPAVEEQKPKKPEFCPRCGMHIDPQQKDTLCWEEFLDGVVS